MNYDGNTRKLEEQLQDKFRHQWTGAMIEVTCDEALSAILALKLKLSDTEAKLAYYMETLKNERQAWVDSAGGLK